MEISDEKYDSDSSMSLDGASITGEEYIQFPIKLGFMLVPEQQEQNRFNEEENWIP